MGEMCIVRFDGRDLPAVRQGERTWVSVRCVCRALGLYDTSQKRKLRNWDSSVVAMIATTGSDGRKYEMLCIALEALPRWLATIDHIAEPKRERLMAWQRNVAEDWQRCCVTC